MFFNISKEKQTTFLEAAKREFTTKPFDQATVNSIVKNAKIARGSFYNYFEDLDSLFEYIFEEVKTKRYSNVFSLMKEAKGDFFVFIENLFRSDYDEFTKEGTYSLFRNYIYYTRNKQKKTIKEGILLPLTDMLQKNIDLKTVFDLSWVNVSFEEFLDAMEMTIIIIVDLFITSEQLNYTKEQTMSLFKKRINVIRKGISK